MTDRLADVSIRPWADEDLWLLERLLGETEATRYIGGSESLDQIRARHDRYLKSDPAVVGVFAITTGLDSCTVGWVGYWETQWNGEAVWECGWNVLPEWQHKGVATAGTSLMIERLRAHEPHRRLHAFPSIDNTASNALCRTLGFELLGSVDVEYPPGHTMRSNDWSLDLTGWCGPKSE